MCTLSRHRIPLATYAGETNNMLIHALSRDGSTNEMAVQGFKFNPWLCHWGCLAMFNLQE